MSDSDSLSTVDAGRNLPPITVDGHALFEFSLKMNRALKRLEKNFAVPEKATVPYSRQMWCQPPRKPR